MGQLLLRVKACALCRTEIAPQVPVRATSVVYPLRDANAALAGPREGKLTGAAVLVP